MVAILEQRVGTEEPEDNDSLLVQVALQSGRINLLQTTHNDWVKTHRDSSPFHGGEIQHVQEGSGRRDGFVEEGAANPPDRNDGATSKMKVPEPKAFNGARNAKELGNFLWDMEQYFRAV